MEGGGWHLGFAMRATPSVSEFSGDGLKLGAGTYLFHIMVIFARRR
jgi:hypothetical protein